MTRTCLHIDLTFQLTQENCIDIYIEKILDFLDNLQN